jgi:small subunit ribosomal protein S29
MPFSNSTSLEANNAIIKKKNPSQLRAVNAKAVKTLRIKKKIPVKTGRPPAPGERKALRKRIVLSNSNALEVSTMANMTPELDPAQIGVVLGLPGPLVDQLRAVEAFKTTQGWGLFRRPAMLIREESVEIAKTLQAAQDAKQTSVAILDGERGAGKSLMLLQAMATAFLKGWIVVNIPEGKYT